MAPGEKGGAAVVGRALTGKGQTPGPPSGGLARQALLYGLIGGGCAALDGGVFALLHNMGLGVYGANAISVHCGILCSFFLNRRFNFRRTDRAGSRFARFYGVGLLGLLLSQGLLWAGTQILCLPALWAKGGAVALVAALQFVLNRTVTFRP